MTLPPTLLPSAAAGTAGFALVLLVLAGPLYRIGLSLDTAFAILRWAAYVGLAGLAAAAAAGSVAYRKQQRLMLALAIAAGVASFVAVAIPLIWQLRVRNLPPIHDITTDLENPPAFEAIVPLRADATTTLDRPPMLAAQQREGYPDIAPITLPLPPDRVFNRALDVAERLGWEIVASDPEKRIIEATDSTRWFGFKDDIVVRVMPWGSGSRVDVRSVSRVGRSDLGRNARRIRAFFETLQES